MKIWVDAQLSPSIVNWIYSQFGIESFSLKYLGLRDATDQDIFQRARDEDNIVIMTKDSDFLNLLERFGSPPKIIWITCGNTSNENLKTILINRLQTAIDLLLSGEDVIEISG